MSKSLLTVLSIVTLLTANVRADIDEPQGVCIRGARTYTCSDGTVIDACDDCSSGSSGGNGNAGKGLIKFVGIMVVAGVVTAIFIPSFVLSPAVALELFVGKGKNIFGDKKKAAEAHKEYVEARTATEKAGEDFIEAENALYDAERDGPLRDSLIETNTATRHAFTPPKKMWWTDMPHLEPTLDWRCRQAGLEFPFRMNPDDPIAGFVNVNAMLNQCIAANMIEPGLGTIAPAADGSCPAATRQCMHTRPDGSAACCPQDHTVFNSVDNLCYRTTDYRSARWTDAGRFLGGEYCPASSR